MTNSINKHLRLKFPYTVPTHTTRIFYLKLSLIAFAKQNPSDKYIFNKLLANQIISLSYFVNVCIRSTKVSELILIHTNTYISVSFLSLDFVKHWSKIDIFS